MSWQTMQRSLQQLVLSIFVAAVIAATGMSVRQVYAAQHPSCNDYICNQHEQCFRVDCQVCFTDNRCALVP